MDKYIVIGNPISHSKSPLIHTTFAKLSNQNLQYEKVEGPIGGFKKTIDDFRSAGGRGVNITAPFKLDAFAYANHHSASAQIAGAVNCLKFEDGKVYGENFDGVGLVRDVVHNHKTPLKGKRVLVMGAGGVVRGMLVPFLNEEPAELVIANRTIDKAKSLVDISKDYVKGSTVVKYSSYPELQGQKFDVVFNATSASLTGELPPIPPTVFADNSLAYELAYGKGLTPFLRLATNAGVKNIADGVGMLVEQAAEAFNWWRGIRPDTQDVIKLITIPIV
jgi:shikimate dehydrogenase